MSLVVYKASAGSGKTWTLTRDYILLSLTGFESGAWRHILAVTFTNKAAAEMKGRVIEKLNEISCGEDDELTVWYSAQTGLDAKEIQSRAGAILCGIIHDYGSFSVQTIDSFLQRVFRSFLYELDVNYSYDLMLDSSRMIEETARALIFEVRKDSQAFGELMKFLEYSMSSEEKYNIQKDVAGLGAELTREELYRYLPALMEFLDSPDKMEKLLEKLRSTIFTYKSWMEEQAAVCLKIIWENSLNESHFVQTGRGVYSYIKNLNTSGFEFRMNGYMQSCYNKDGKYHRDESKKEIITTKLAPVFDAMVERFNNENPRIYGLYMVYKNLHVLNLLKYLEEKRKELLLNNGFFYLGDVPRALKSVLAQGGAGMIYEKTGNRYDHIFIDEFQDTSYLQWDNFLPLVENSLAQGLRCNIVGDVKQAIYRWRNGDWAILANGLKAQFPGEIKEETLDTNRRSLPAIIDFNNNFFKQAVSALDDGVTPAGLPSITDLYKDLHQKKWKTGDGQKGYVRVEGVGYELMEEFNGYVQGTVPVLINELWEKGCNDIAILVRSNREISEMLEALIASSPKYPVVTERSFRLETHPAIRFITALLSALAFPDDKSISISAAWWYHIALGKEKDPGSAFSFHEKIQMDEYFSDKGYDVKKVFMPDDPYTMSCAVAEEFGLTAVDSWQPYLSAFLDAVQQFQNSQGGTIQDLVKWYDNHKDELQIQIENMKEAVKIMTIHKSKGLQFSTVIIPYAGWKFRQGKARPLWLHSGDDCLKDIPAVNVPFKNDLTATMFANAFTEEEFKVTIDNLNMLYVAMTRAETQMYIYFPVKKKSDQKKQGEPSTGIAGLMEKTMSLTGITPEIIPAGVAYSSGSPVAYKKSEEDKKGKERISKGCYAGIPELVISVDRMQEVFSEKDTGIKHGVILHNILEQVRTAEDFGRIVDESLKKNIIEKDTAAALRSSFDTLMKNSNFADWFSGKYEIYNEHTLISAEGLHRPDRIMISGNTAIVADYKTGTIDPEKYKSQLKKYMRLLKETGITDVTGWIVQLDRCEMVEVG